MQFRDLKTQYLKLKNEINNKVQEVMINADFIMGKTVIELEKELAEYVGVKHCITCANGTDALSIALMAWGIGRNDAVFVPDFTFFSSGEVVSHCGATPIFVDVNRETFNIDASALDKAIDLVISEGKLIPKAIVAVDLFGLPANFEKIRAIANKYNLLVLEDGAQGFGGSINGKMACSFGDIATTSFFPAKPLGCYGDGGAIFTDNDEWADLIKSIRVHGKGTMKYDNVRIGLNSRLDTIQAAILSVKLKAFKEFELDSVNSVADRYTELFGDSVVTPKIPEGYRSSWAQYTLILNSREERDNLKEFLLENNIPSMVYYPKAMHNQIAFNKEESYLIDCSTSENLCECVLSLPMHPYLTDKDINEVVACIKKFFSK